VAPQGIDLFRDRLRNQRLAGSTFRSAAEVVSHLGAVQAQDYPGAKWAVASRATGLSDADVDRAFSDGRILRTHILRPTWHFVAPADIRWMLMLSGPRVLKKCTTYFRNCELDGATLKRVRTVFTRALRDHAYLTRTELAAALSRARITASGIRLAFAVMNAELEGLICSGPLRGKQFTYALLDERVPVATHLDRDAAVAELTRRYFRSHGPATVRDFVWWSGLTSRDAKQGLDLLGSSVRHETIGERTYWFLPPDNAGATPAAVYLLSTYDENLVAYRDRGNPAGGASSTRPAGGIDAYAQYLVANGEVIGTWKRMVGKTAVAIAVTAHRPLTRAEREAIDAAAVRYGKFLGTPAQLTITVKRGG
jgi:hypothetical protein